MIESCELPLPPATVAGVNDQLACDAVNPARDSDTSPTKPFTGDTATVYDTPPPAVVLADEGATPTAKSGGGETTNVAETEWLRLPEVPVIVSG